MKNSNLWGVVLLLFLPVALKAQEPAEKGLDEMSLDQLSALTVSTASKFDEQQWEAPGIISIISKDELQRFGGTTLKDILERVPGLVRSGVFMTDRSIISARGDQIQDSSSHVLLLINGRPVREILEEGIKSEIYESFPVNAIERIEVVKGPGSVLYGSDAFSGVINVITRKAEKNEVSVTGLAGDGGAFNTLAKASVTTGDFSLMAAAEEHGKPDWNVDYQGIYPTVLTVYPITIPDNGAGLYVGMEYKGFRFMSTLDRWENAFFIPLPFAEGQGIAKWDKEFYSLGYNLQAAPGWKMDFELGLTRSTFWVDSYPSISRDSAELVGEWTNFVGLGKRSSLTFGGTFNQLSGAETYYQPNPPVFISNSSRSRYGFYAQADYALLDNLKAIGGCQANVIESNGQMALVPRAGLVWNAVGPFYLKALYSEAFRAPSINELTLDHPVLKGNPDLLPEYVHTVDLSVGYQKGRVEAVLTCFNSDYINTIFQNRIIFPGLYENQTGVDTIQGLEFEGKCYLDREILLEGSVLYQTSRDTAGDTNVTPIANWGAKGGISYKSDNGLTIGLFDIYQGGLDPKYAATLNPSPGAYNILNADFKWSLNRTLGWTGGLKYELDLQADNVLDEQVWLPIWGLPPGLSMPNQQGRVVYAGLTLTQNLE